MKVFQAMRTKDGMVRIPSQHKQAIPKPSTAVILCTTTNRDPDSNKILMVTKTKRTSKKQYYWSGSTVFPGGLLDPASDGQFVDICLKYYSQWFTKFHFQYDDIMYRINGLRELFEETGILLCRSKESIKAMIDNDDINYPINASIFDQKKHKIDINITEWRHKIMKDSFQFEVLFKSINMIPDILSLVNWARIQTPWFTGSRGWSGKRWDVRFYLTLIHQNDAKLIQDVDNDELNELDNALGKEIFRIDWVDIKDAIGPKKIEKYKSIPHVTNIQLAEFYQIIHIENCLLNEWRNAYFKRNIVAIRFKAALRKPDNSILSLFNGDYLYNKVGDENDVECDVDKENNPRYLQRIMFNDKRKMTLFKVLINKRLYLYKTPKL